MEYILSFLVTLILTPVLAKKFKRLGIVGEDLHKEDRRKIPELGGISILTGFLIGILVAFSRYEDVKLLIAALIVTLTGIVGIIDYFKQLSPKEKIVSLSLIGIVLVPFCNPYLFGVNFGILYLLSLPIFFAIVCNFTNMLAGFNGLEIGTGAIACLGLGIVARLSHAETSEVISLTMFACLIAFLLFNKYPAKVFPSDVGTLPIGAAIFCAAVFGKLELYGIIVLIPYAIDALLKYLSVGVMTRQQQKATIVRNGLLYIPEGSNLSLPRLFLKRKPMRERELVIRVWCVEFVFCLFAVFLKVLCGAL